MSKKVGREKAKLPGRFRLIAGGGTRAWSSRVRSRRSAGGGMNYAGWSFDITTGIGALLVASLPWYARP